MVVRLLRCPLAELQSGQIAEADLHYSPSLCETLHMSDQPPERTMNIHADPEMMGGVYANFANVSHSDYEFTITFARVDHESPEETIPGVVVSRVSLSPKFMAELLQAAGENFSRWQAREQIRDLPESDTEA